jgi:hypothetical protein
MVMLAEQLPKDYDIEGRSAARNPSPRSSSGSASARLLAS